MARPSGRPLDPTFGLGVFSSVRSCATCFDLNRKGIESRTAGQSEREPSYACALLLSGLPGGLPGRACRPVPDDDRGRLPARGRPAYRRSGPCERSRSRSGMRAYRSCSPEPSARRTRLRSRFVSSGRMIERRVNNGDRVRPGQLVARLEPQNEQNALRSARANLVGRAGAADQRPQQPPPPGAARRPRGRLAGRARPGAGVVPDGAVPGRVGGGAGQVRPGPAGLHRAQGRRRRGHHRGRRRAGRGGVGRADDRHAGAPGRQGRRLRRARPGDPLGAEQPGGHRVADRTTRP